MLSRWGLLGICAFMTTCIGQLSAADLSAGPDYPYFREIKSNTAPQQARLLLAAGLVDGRESEASIALRRAPGSDDYGVSLETLARALGLTLAAEESGGFAFETPLGRAQFAAGEAVAGPGRQFRSPAPRRDASWLPHALR